MLETDAKKIGLLMNRTKLKFYFPYAKTPGDIDPDIRDRILQLGAVVRIGCIEVLGSVVGLDYDGEMARVLLDKVKAKLDKIQAAMSNASTLPHQHTYHLLRACFSQQINFLCRTSPPMAFGAAGRLWDKGVAQVLSRIIETEIVPRTPLYDQIMLPAKDGYPGLGLRRASSTSQISTWFASVIESMTEFARDGTLDDMMQGRHTGTSTIVMAAIVLNAFNKQECFRKLELFPPSEIFPQSHEYDPSVSQRICNIFHPPV
jgi:hypothetical protein